MTSPKRNILLLLLWTLSSPAAAAAAAFVIPRSTKSSPASAARGLFQPTTKITNQQQQQQKKPSSTTLYYRDDVPPMGSTAKWETPNDFPQFLTQCSLQSFMFLLHSLRDDHTVEWLNEFTEPVLQSNMNMNITNMAQPITPAATSRSINNHKKISLAEAAQSALDSTDRVVTEATARSKSQNTKHKTTKQQKKSANKSTDKKGNSIPFKTACDAKAKLDTSAAAAAAAVKKNDMTPRAAESGPPKNGKPVQQLSLASTNLLQANIAIRKAFASHTQMMKKMKMRSSSTSSSSSEEEEEPVVDVTHNTGISALYSLSNIPTKRTGTDDGPKKNFSPFSNNKNNNNNKPNKKPAAVMHKVSSRPISSSTMSCTGALYGAPVNNENTNAKQQQQQEDDSNIDHQAGFASASSNNNNSNLSPAEKKKQNGPILKYHGLAILNRTKFPTWSSYFEKLLDQPKESWVIQSSYAHIPSYDLDIDPASICRRMLSVRAQIAKEFEHDLDVIARMGGRTLTSYQIMLQEIREQRAEDELQQQKDQLEKQMPKSMEESISTNNGAKSTADVHASKQPPKPSLQRANLLFLDSAVASGSDDNDDNDNSGYAPSPLRRGNFDLLVLLATQEAIHRVLNDPSRQARKSAEHGINQFLQDFYVTRLLSHFSGDQRYGRADDFLEELLESPPRMITMDNHNGNGNGNNNEGEHADEFTKGLTYLVDPVTVAETILNEREKVALEWKEQVAEQTKVDHMTIQKMVLAKLMGGTLDDCQMVNPEGDLGTESCFE